MYAAQASNHFMDSGRRDRYGRLGNRHRLDCSLVGPSRPVVDPTITPDTSAGTSLSRRTVEASFPLAADIRGGREVGVPRSRRA